MDKILQAYLEKANRETREEFLAKLQKTAASGNRAAALHLEKVEKMSEDQWIAHRTALNSRLIEAAPTLQRLAKRIS